MHKPLSSLYCIEEQLNTNTHQKKKLEGTKLGSVYHCVLGIFLYCLKKYFDMI
jgi:hypothetical protein